MACSVPFTPSFGSTPLKGPFSAHTYYYQYIFPCLPPPFSPPLCLTAHPLPVSSSIHPSTWHFHSPPLLLSFLVCCLHTTLQPARLWSQLTRAGTSASGLPHNILVRHHYRVERYLNLASEHEQAMTFLEPHYSLLVTWFHFSFFLLSVASVLLLTAFCHRQGGLLVGRNRVHQ